jgi:hypothetical protein
MSSCYIGILVVEGSGRGGGVVLHLVTLCDTHHSVGLLWTKDRTVTETYTWQHTTIPEYRHPPPRRDSKPQSRLGSGHRPTPWTAWPLGSAGRENTRRKIKPFNIILQLVWVFLIVLLLCNMKLYHCLQYSLHLSSVTWAYSFLTHSVRFILISPSHICWYSIWHIDNNQSLYNKVWCVV